MGAPPPSAFLGVQGLGAGPALRGGLRLDFGDNRRTLPVRGTRAMTERALSVRIADFARGAARELSPTAFQRMRAGWLSFGHHEGGI